MSMRFGGILRAKRLEKGWTQEQLGEKIGRSKNNISQFELGKREPSIGQLRLLSSLLGTTVDELVGGAYPPPSLRETGDLLYQGVSILPWYASLPLTKPVGYYIADFPVDVPAFFFTAPEDVPEARVKKGDRLLVCKQMSPKASDLLLLESGDRARLMRAGGDPRRGETAEGGDEYTVLGRVLRVEIEISPSA